MKQEQKHICADCRHLKKIDGSEYCDVCIRQYNKVTGIHKLWECKEARERKPSWIGDVPWCGARGKLWEPKTSQKKQKPITAVADHLVDMAGFSPEDAEVCAKEILTILEKLK